MKKLVVDFDPDTKFCELRHPYSKRFTDFVKSGIRPYSYRRYNSSNHRWSVHFSRLPTVINIAKRYFDYVDWSALPEAEQIDLVSRIKGTVEDESFLYRRPDLGPYGVLHLMDTAPLEVVKAAHKALALKHHPDHGGSEEKFREIQEAFEEITKSRN